MVVVWIPFDFPLDGFWVTAWSSKRIRMEVKMYPGGIQNASALKADIKRNIEKMQKWNDPLISKGQRGKAIAIFEIQGPAIACPWAGIRSSDIRNPTSEIVGFLPILFLPIIRNSPILRFQISINFNCNYEKDPGSFDNLLTPISFCPKCHCAGR